jgi:hypothetical protein
MRRTQPEQIWSALPYRADLNEALSEFADAPLPEVTKWTTATPTTVSD